MTTKLTLTADVVATLRDARIDGPRLFLTGQLDRSLYTRVNKALEVLGGKWDRKVKAHVFEDDPGLTIEEALELGAIVYTDQRKELNFFPTPKAVVDQMLEEVGEIRPGDHVLEPSAGKGAIIDGLLDAGVAQIDYCELDMDMATALKAKHGPNVCLVCTDFLAFNPGPGEPYGVIVMNPPFSKGRDVQHVAHALDLLAPGGRLVAIMGAGVTFRSDKASLAFLDLLADEFPGHHFERLPQGAFKESGTMVNTVMLVAQRPAAETQKTA